MRAAPGRTSSGRRSSPEVLWPDGINHSSYVQPNLIVQLIRHRADCVRPAETCEKVPAGHFSALRQRSKRAYKWTRLRTAKESTAPSRTYSDSSRTCRPNHTIENCLGCTNDDRLSFIQKRTLESSAPNPNLRVSISAFRPKKIPSGSFLHVSADASRSARSLISCTFDFDRTDELFDIPYSRGTSGEGQRLEWALPGAARTGQ